MQKHSTIKTSNNRPTAGGFSGVNPRISSRLAEAEKNQAERDRLVAEAKRVMASVSALGESVLCWLKTAAQMSDDAELGKAAELELQKRKMDRGVTAVETGVLPEATK